MTTFGLPPEPHLPASVRALCRVMIAIIVIGTAYGLVTDEPDRMVVMSRATFERRIADERIEAARLAMDAVRPLVCPDPQWRDLFPPRRLNPPM